MAESSMELYNRAINWEPAIARLGRGWTFDDLRGKSWPAIFPTRKAALERAMRHRDFVCREALDAIREESENR